MATPIARFVKDPNANLPYSVDWSGWLPSGETVDSVTWTVPSGITQVSASHTTTAATVRLSGGTAGTSYQLACRVTTTPSGYIDERTIEIVVAER